VIVEADLLDIQGGVLNGYSKFPYVAHLFGSIEAASVEQWRTFLGGLSPTQADWGETEPPTTLNVALSARGLALLQPMLTAELARSFEAFAQGMPARARVLGDTQAFPGWEQRHVWLSIHARNADTLEAAVRRLLGQAAPLTLSDDARGAALFDENGFRYEHFGFRDDISYPVLEGSPNTKPSELAGRGKLVGRRWEPIKDGEFILGHENERGVDALAGLSQPLQQLLRNGTFAVFRTLSQDVVAFRRYAKKKSAPNAPVEHLTSRMVGRMPNGEPLVPSTASGAEQALSSFDYDNDPTGAGCPLGAHVRRANPRSNLNGGRHHLIRRGVSYGEPLAPDREDTRKRGVYFVAFNADLEDQFEFVQKQWLNGPVGNGTHARDPLVGVGPERGLVIEGDPDSGRLPILLLDIPNFVTFLGGQYYFYPARAGLRSLCAAWLPPRAPSLYEVSR
jgi:Dyp-type peroxidase family